MGSGCATIEMMRHTLLFLFLGVTVVDIEGQSVVFPSNTEDAVLIEQAGHLGKVPRPSLPLRWKRLNRLKNIWSERENNRTRADIIGMVKPMDNEVEWGTDIFGRMEKGNLCGDGSTYCARPSHYPSTAIARALKKNKKKELINVLFDEPKPQLRLRSSAEAFGEPSLQKWGRTQTTSRGTWCRATSTWLSSAAWCAPSRPWSVLAASWTGRGSRAECCRGGGPSAGRSTPSTGWWR